MFPSISGTMIAFMSFGVDPRGSNYILSKTLGRFIVSKVYYLSYSLSVFDMDGHINHSSPPPRAPLVPFTCLLVVLCLFLFYFIFLICIHSFDKYSSKYLIQFYIPIYKI